MKLSWTCWSHSLCDFVVQTPFMSPFGSVGNLEIGYRQISWLIRRFIFLELQFVGCPMFQSHPTGDIHITIIHCLNPYLWMVQALFCCFFLHHLSADFHQAQLRKMAWFNPHPTVSYKVGAPSYKLVYKPGNPIDISSYISIYIIYQLYSFTPVLYIYIYQLYPSNPTVNQVISQLS